MTDDKAETSKTYDTIKLGIDETAPKREESARQLVGHAEEITRVYAKDTHATGGIGKKLMDGDVIDVRFAHDTTAGTPPTINIQTH